MAVIDFKTRQEIKPCASDAERIDAYVSNLEGIALRSLYAIRAAIGPDWANKIAERISFKIKGE